MYCGDLGDELEGAELGTGLPAEEDGAAAADQVTSQVQFVLRREGAASHSSITNKWHMLSLPLMCAGCGEQVCDRFFLLAAGRVWHSGCLRCSQCHCELQTHPSLFWRDGNIYCQQDYCRMFGVGQCARCSRPIPASAFVMRSGELTFHPHCFSCQVSHLQYLSVYLSFYLFHCGVPPSHDLHQTKPHLKEGESVGWGGVCVCGEESVSSPEPRLDDRAAGGQVRRRSKRIRTCFRSEQLRALESYFAQKHNPDGKDWTCLAHKTGLPKRVLQVKLRRDFRCDMCGSRMRGPSCGVPSPPTTLRSARPPPPPQDAKLHRPNPHPRPALPTNHRPSSPAPSTSCSSPC
uniref:LIM/homeobox protein Lhx9 n=1 Tax=Myripristis murdjan TaxID=586833 RepID=A0A667XUI4_9TELE